MTTKRPLLAKLTRPRLHKAVARERLFELLDDKREHPVVWIVGPPGAGKTTLAASYLEEAGAPAIWYQIDPGDSDPATFFFYLKQAIEAVGKKKAKPLPLLTPEYLPDLPGFARRFLRDGFAQLPEDVILVFDNYHDIAPDSTLHTPFKAALAEVPPGSNIIVLSRTDPPPMFADALVNQAIATVTWEELRLTQKETTAIAASRGITDKAVLRSLHEQSTGWMAGVTLMLERLRGGKGLEALAQGEARDTVFNYFAGLIFDHAPAQTKEVLMKTSFLARISAPLAEAITGMAKAIKHIEELHHRHLFTDRVAGEEVSYQYHALFRAFLKSRAAVAYSIDERREIARLAAVSLVTAGDVEQAFELFAEAQDWNEAERLLIETAANLIEHGRWKTLEQWVEILPESRLHANPWAQYWLGRSKIVVDPAATRLVIEAAYRNFTETGEEVGQLLCATTILECLFFEYEDCTRMDVWIERVVALLQKRIRPPKKEDELRANSVVMLGATIRAPRHSMLEACLHRVEDLLEEPFDANVKVAAARMLHEYANVAMDPEPVRIANAVALPLLDSPKLSVHHAFGFRHAEGYTHYLYGRYLQAFESFHIAEAIAAEHSFRNTSLMTVWFHRGLCERRSGLLDRAEATIREIERFPLYSGRHWRAGLDLLRGSVAFDRGDVDRAIEHILASYHAYESLGMFNGAVLVGTVGANMAIAGRRFDIASRILLDLHSLEFGSIADNYLGAVVMNEAWLAHRTGDIASRDKLLGEALRRARDERARVRLRWYTNALSELLPVAIAAGIEAETARALGREFAVIPEPRGVEDWPWPVKVYTLGRFELLVDGEIPEYSRKAPKKVLALLKAIIAHGGRDVSEQKLIDALWPDEEGDAARRAMVTTLHRLRKLLGNMKAIRQTGSELTLDEDTCWIDALAFEHRIDGPEAAPDGQFDVIRLYQGAFLPQDDAAAWTIPIRERLRSKFIHGIGKLGASLEQASRHEAAIELYSRGIHADPLIEPFYQGLMRCYEKLNRRAEAASTYRRLRETLSVILGVTPSPTSQRLFETLRLN